MSRYTPISIVAALLLAATLASAQAPDELSFQGRLTNLAGTPINAAGQNVTFALYKGATKIWQETQSVDVDDGVFNVMLGKVTPLDTVRFNEDVYLGIKVGTDLEIFPPTALVGTAYARALPGLYTYFADDGTRQSHNVIGGAPGNEVSPGAVGATICGGGGVESGGDRSNEVKGDFGTIGGGGFNTASAGGTVGGGYFNTAGDQAVAAGGQNNFAASYSSVGGGYDNYAWSSNSAIPGGEGNETGGSHSFAAGYHARAKHEGTFVWNDRSVTSGNDSLLSTDTNQFIVRAANGVGINQAPVNVGIHLKQNVAGSPGGIRIEYSADSDYWDTWVDALDDYNFAYNGTLKGYIRDTDGEYIVASDARLKEDVRAYDTVLENVLQLHPATYRFLDAANTGPRSVGLIAQEVEPFFPELIDEKDGMKGMNYMGLSVVAIKAIQELYTIVETQQELIETLQRQIDQLR